MDEELRKILNEADQRSDWQRQYELAIEHSRIRAKIRNAVLDALRKDESDTGIDTVVNSIPELCADVILRQSQKIAALEAKVGGLERELYDIKSMKRWNPTGEEWGRMAPGQKHDYFVCMEHDHVDGLEQIRKEVQG